MDGHPARNVSLFTGARRRLRDEDPIPTEVRAQMARADRLADVLSARGQSLRFESDGTGVAAYLCDGAGNVLRRVGPLEICDARDPDPDA